MHKLQRDFADFHSRLTLNASQKRRTEQAWNGLDAVLKRDDELRERVSKVFVQGSYAHNTLVKPKYDHHEFDLDVVVVLNCEDNWGRRMQPNEVLTLLAKRLRSHHNYRGKVGQRDRCVRIDFAGEFHLDVVPCHRVGSYFSDDYLEVPDKVAQRWVRTDPAGLDAWYTRRNQELDGRFKRCAKYLREWKREQYVKRGPPSLVLDVLLGHYGQAGHNSDAEFFADALARMAFALERRSGVPHIPNPALPSEDLGRNWNKATYSGFVRHLRTAANKAEAALHEPDRVRARQIWAQLLGERFAEV